MGRTVTGASGIVQVYAHNPHPLMAMTQSKGRKTPRKAANGQFLPAKRTPAKRAPAKKATPRRRNPAPTAARRRNPSFGSRAGSLYKQAGGLVLGGIAAEQVGILIQSGMPVDTSPTTATLVPAAVTGVAGVALASMKGDFASNVGLGMVVTSAANLVALVAGKLGLGDATTGTSGDILADKPATSSKGLMQQQRQAVKAQQRLAAQNGVSGYVGGYSDGYGVAAPKAGCGCHGNAADVAHLLGA